MTLSEAKQLKVGDAVLHSGHWAYHFGTPKVFVVLSNDAKCIRVQKDSRFTSRYEWGGCSLFVTEDFFASCNLSVPVEVR